MQQLGIEMIPAYSPEARGRSERAFGTHQGRLPQELAAAGITDMDAANAYLRDAYLPAFNTEFAHPSREDGSAFVPCPSQVVLDDILCEQVARTVGKDNCVRVPGRVLQIPADRHRYHYIKAKVKVCRHMDGTLSLFHGPGAWQDTMRRDSYCKMNYRPRRNVRRPVGAGRSPSDSGLRGGFSVTTKADNSFVTEADKSIC